MKAVVFERFGDPADVLGIRDIPVPQPGPGQVRVRMLVSPINPADLLMVRGKYAKLPELPATPGFEGVGVVESGAGLYGKLLVGRRVVVLNRETGNWKEQVLIPLKQAVPISSRIPLEQAAMFFVNPATAYVMTRNVLRIPPGRWLLQTAAGSALGRMVIRLGLRYRFRTLNVVRRAEQESELLDIGADRVIVLTSPEELVEKVKQITGEQGVTHAIDPVGGALGSSVVKCLAPGGRMLVYGTLADDPLCFSPRDLMTPPAGIEGFWLVRYMQGLSLPRKIHLMRKIAKLIREGVLTSKTGPSFPLDRITDAVTEAERSGKGGKILLKIATP